MHLQQVGRQGMVIFDEGLANTSQEAAAVDELFPFFPFPAERESADPVHPDFVSALRIAAAAMRETRPGR